MKLNIILLSIILLGFTNSIFSQEFNKTINKDSLFKEILKIVPEEKQKEFKKTYEEGDEKTKEFLLFMLSMPRSSKKEMIKNFENNYKEIELLKRKYAEIVPDSLIISIEFNPENKLINKQESIDLKIYQKITYEGISFVKQEWNLDRNSDKLSEMLNFIGWNKNTLNVLKEMLDSANCVSIENDEITIIGFARSGMGKYYYNVFDKNLTKKDIEKYDDGCRYIFYKDNIVFEYGGGAIGPQCFPD